MAKVLQQTQRLKSRDNEKGYSRLHNSHTKIKAAEKKTRGSILYSGQSPDRQVVVVSAAHSPARKKAVVLRGKRSFLDVGHDEEIEILNAAFTKLKHNKQKNRAFLCRAGILNPDGTLTDTYRD